MHPALIVLAVLLVLWLLASLKTSRPDGTILKVHPYRRLMFFIMPTRSESVVFFERKIDATAMLSFVEKARGEFDANMTHTAVAAAAIALRVTDRMNRFTVGRRLYQRKGRWMTFAMKRKKTGEGFDRTAKLATVKLEFVDGESFPDFAARINDLITENRSGKKTTADKEFSLFNSLPRPLLGLAARALGWLDYYNLLPGLFIKTDPMYTSIFMANLGSLGMDAGFHHLYEYGTCPLFIMIGNVREEPCVVDGEVVIRPMVNLRFTFDERIDDGLNARFGIDAFVRVLSDPERWLGGVSGAYSGPMWPRQDWESEDGFFQVRR